LQSTINEAEAMMQGLKALPPNVFEETIGGLVHGLVHISRLLRRGRELNGK